MEEGYLRRVIGEVLVHGLRDTALADPADPIEYLAKWLLQRDEVERQWGTFRDQQKRLADDKAEYLANLQAEVQRLEAERRACEEERRRLAEEEEQLQKEAAASLQASEEEEDKPEVKPEAEAPAEEVDASTGYSTSLSDTF
jgi:peptidoglycan hydrolase CwlO-like protein